MYWFWPPGFKFLSKQIWGREYSKILRLLKVSKFQNEFMKSSFCSVAQYRAEILTIFGSYFGRNDDFINLFWNLLTFKRKKKLKGLSFVCMWWSFIHGFDKLIICTYFCYKWLENTYILKWLVVFFLCIKCDQN